MVDTLRPTVLLQTAAAAGNKRRVCAAGPMEEFVGECRLADARFPSEEDHTARTLDGLTKGFVEPPHLNLAADEHLRFLLRLSGLSHRYSGEAFHC